MNIVLINTEKELKSFPITQSIKLKSDTNIEDNDLQNTIHLFEVTRKDSLVNLGNPFNYNLSLIKRDFDKVDLAFSKILEPDVVPDSYLINITPKQPLDLLSTYLLYIDKNISKPYLEVGKLVSKSLSTVTVKSLDDIDTDISNIEIKILETTRLLKNQSLVKIETVVNYQPISAKQISLDLKKDNKLVFKNIEICFESPVYIKDETFNIVVNRRETALQDSLSYLIDTCGNSDILPMEVEEASTKVSNQAILDFYNTPISPNLPITYTLEYLSLNTILISLPDTITKEQIDIENITVVNKYAFNNYLLNNLKLFDDSLKYILKVTWDDFENAIIIDLFYTPEELLEAQVDTMFIDLSGW